MQPDPVSNSFGVSHSSAEFGTDHWISKLIPHRPLNFTCRLVHGWGEYLSEITSERHQNLIQKHRRRETTFHKVAYSRIQQITLLDYFICLHLYPIASFCVFPNYIKKGFRSQHYSLCQSCSQLYFFLTTLACSSISQPPLKTVCNMDVAHSSPSCPRKIAYFIFLKNLLFIGLQCIKQEDQNKVSFPQFHKEINWVLTFRSFHTVETIWIFIYLCTKDLCNCKVLLVLRRQNFLLV